MAGPRVIVAGAGALGGWTALELQRQGAEVILVDPWGPGNARSSSGGETRLIRCTYGPDIESCLMAAESWRRWHIEKENFERPVLQEHGVLWLFRSDEEDYATQSIAALEGGQVPHEVITPEQGRFRWPQFLWGDVELALFEPEAGVLLARDACQEVMRSFLAAGGRHLTGRLVPGEEGGAPQVEGGLEEVGPADLHVWACGPWLPFLFPDPLAERVLVSRQEVFFFGVPGRLPAYGEGRMPPWVDVDDEFWYGIPGSNGKGFKLSAHMPGPLMDPENDDRSPSGEALMAARRFLAKRFPELEGAPLLESRVCCYSLTQDGRPFCEPALEPAGHWWVGGGNGHSFKFGPVLGREFAQRILS